MSGSKKIKVLVIDDSAFVRTMLTTMLQEDSNIEVVGAAADPLVAREMIKNLSPDVLTLDVEMPKMDGLTFLEKVMSLRPMPVVMVSSVTQERASETIRALELGAVDCIGKPTGDEPLGLQALGEELVGKIKVAASARVRKYEKPISNANEAEEIPISRQFDPKNSIIAIGASTGGVEAIREVLPKFPENSPPILITQHMPSNFTKPFADRLDSLSAIKVVEATNNCPINPGCAYVAPGNKHMQLALNRVGHGYVVRLNEGDKVSGHRPSVDVMFESVAENAGSRAIGVILTGMGKDGAGGMLSLKRSGSYNIGQNENTSIVYGMPKAAFENGAVDIQIALEEIAEEIIRRFNSLEKYQHKTG